MTRSWIRSGLSALFALFVCLPLGAQNGQSFTNFAAQLHFVRGVIFSRMISPTLTTWLCELRRTSSSVEPLWPLLVM